MFIHDSLSNARRLISPEQVSIYACGITPYSAAHVGHARTYVVFDTLAQVLRLQGHRVRLVRNITDIDDKIIRVAQLEGVPWHRISDRYAERNRTLMRATGLQVPEEPKASDHIPAIVDIVHQLQALGLAYVSATGDVLYRVDRYKGPHLVQHRTGESRSEQGLARVEQDGKEDARDFALWKRVESHEPGFDSPWGWGRPGWHIECTAMIGALFQGHVTIHGGGTDLKFPHHQAEIMQSEPVFGTPLADVWMHNGSVLSNGQKMSKSLGNVVGWSEALQMADEQAPGLGADVLRYALLKTHWGQPFQWNDRVLPQAASELRALAKKANASDAIGPSSFVDQLRDNFNMPKALGWLHAMAGKGHGGSVRESLQVLGICPLAWSSLTNSSRREDHGPTVHSHHGRQAIEMSSEKEKRTCPLRGHVYEFLELGERERLWQTMEAQRQAARERNDWATADRLRAQLQAWGARIQDPKIAPRAE